MPRTTELAVQKVLLDDYDAGDGYDMTPFIETASSMVDDLEAWGLGNNEPMAAAKLELIERWLSAHFYKTPDRPFQAAKTGDASATYQGQTGKGLEATYYGQTAVSLDPTGMLITLGEPRGTADLDWLGKVPDDQIPYWERGT